MSEQDKGPDRVAAEDAVPDGVIGEEQQDGDAAAGGADAAGADMEADGAVALGVDELQEQLEQTQAELADAREQSIRALAEAQNVRRRAEKDVTNARRFALEKFVQELLPIIDNLERAMDSAQAELSADSSMLQGVELTLKSFLDVLKRFNVEPVNPIAEPFDPQLHEAISMIKNVEVEPNTVLDVVQKGYTLNGRLVRAAMVVVSSA